MTRQRSGRSSPAARLDRFNGPAGSPTSQARARSIASWSLLRQDHGLGAAFFQKPASGGEDHFAKAALLSQGIGVRPEIDELAFDVAAFRIADPGQPSGGALLGLTPAQLLFVRPIAADMRARFYGFAGGLQAPILRPETHLKEWSDVCQTGLEIATVIQSRLHGAARCKNPLSPK